MADGATPPMRKIIHVDMDAFYASVEQRDTRGYTTLVDADRIRVLAKRGASVTGLAGAFGISEEEVEAVLAVGD